MKNPFNYSIRELRAKALQVRIDLIKALGKAGSGHSGGALGFADVLTTVYFYGAGVDPANPSHPERDRVVFSAGHYSPLIYGVLAHAGYFSVSHFINNYRRLAGNLDGHPNLHTPGIENASGPLGQGVSVAAGMAAAAKLNKKKWRVWLMMSDGEQQEGQTQEALMWAGARKLNNITAFLDANNMQISGKVEDVLPERRFIPRNYQNYGWHVIAIDGHNFKEIRWAIDESRLVSGKPVLIYARTTPGKGVSFMEGDYRWHGKPPRGKEIEAALRDLYKVGLQIGEYYR